MTPPPAALVRPGMVHIYEWMVPVGAGPVEGEADCLTYLYYSAVDPVKDTSSGLVGPLLICRPKSLKKGVQVRGKTKKTQQVNILCGSGYRASYILLNLVL